MDKYEEISSSEKKLKEIKEENNGKDFWEKWNNVSPWYFFSLSPKEELVPAIIWYSYLQT